MRIGRSGKLDLLAAHGAGQIGTENHGVGGTDTQGTVLIFIGGGQVRNGS